MLTNAQFLHQSPVYGGGEADIGGKRIVIAPGHALDDRNGELIPRVGFRGVDGAAGEQKLARGLQSVLGQQKIDAERCEENAGVSQIGVIDFFAQKTVILGDERFAYVLRDPVGVVIGRKQLQRKNRPFTQVLGSAEGVDAVHAVFDIIEIAAVFVGDKLFEHFPP